MPKTNSFDDTFAVLRDMLEANAKGFVVTVDGNTGGFGPYVLGVVNDATHSFAAGLGIIAAIVLVGGLLILSVDE